MKKYFYLLFVAASSIFFSSCTTEEREGHDNKTTPVSVTLATARFNSNPPIKSSGLVVPGETAMISTRAMGIVTSIKVRTGDTVKKGQLLATVSNGDILAKKAQAQAWVSEANAGLHDARKDYERYSELYKRQSVSQKELENITLHYEAIKAKVEAATQMQNEAEAMLAYTILTAPFSGVVTQTLLDAGNMANPGVPILVIERSGSLQVSASLTESDVVHVSPGDHAQIYIESVGNYFTGKVVEVSPSSQMSGGQFHVKIQLLDVDQKDLRAGMYAKVSIESSATNIARKQLMAPLRAIVQRDQLMGLYTVSDQQTAVLRWVKLGEVQGDSVEILSGLNASENFILAADGKLYNGIPVIIK